MKNLKPIIAAISIALIVPFVFSSCTVNRTKVEEQVRTITVNGTGTVNVKPDQLSLTFSIKTSDWNVNTATSSNASTTEKVIAAVIEEGVAKQDIQTHDYIISQETYWQNNREYPGKYNVTNSLSILIRNTSTAGNVIDAAVKNGTNALSQFEYSASDTTSAVREARTKAVQNAADAANLLAGASGCKVDKVMNISEGYTSTRQTAKAMFADANVSMAGGAATPIEEGTISVTANVTITYSLID